MRISVLTLFIFSAASLPSWGRLGETLDQCATRYGAALSHQDFTYSGLNLHGTLFHKGGYIVMACLLEGKDKVDAMCFSLEDADGGLSDNQIALLLNAESDGKQWSKASEPSMDRYWTREDGATAIYETMKHQLLVVSKDLIAASDAAQKADDAKKTQGF
jgi:hypothetical protein